MRILNVKDRTYKLAEPDEKMYRDLIPICQKSLPDPLMAIKDALGHFTAKQQQMMIREAMHAKRAPLSIESPEFNAWLTSMDGAEQVLLAMFKRHQPEMDLEQALDVH